MKTRTFREIYHEIFEANATQPNVALPQYGSTKSLQDVLFSQWKLQGETRDVARRFSAMTRKRIRCHLAARKTAQLLKAGWSVCIAWKIMGQFNARAGGVAKSNSYHITLALEAPFVLLSTACEIYSVKPRSARWLAALKTLLLPSAKRNSSAIPATLSGLKTTFNISNKAVQCASDATLLLFFHELSHIIFGHVGAGGSSLNSDDRRALEADADFNAGSLFARALHDEGASINEIRDRIFAGGMLLGTVLKAVSTPSDNYHFPTVRLNMFLAGAEVQVNFMQQRNELKKVSWENQLMAESNNFRRKLRKTSLGSYVGNEIRIEEDLKSFALVTLPRRDELKKTLLPRFKLR